MSDRSSYRNTTLKKWRMGDNYLVLRPELHWQTSCYYELHGYYIIQRMPGVLQLTASYEAITWSRTRISTVTRHYLGSPANHYNRVSSFAVQYIWRIRNWYANWDARLLFCLNNTIKIPVGVLTVRPDGIYITLLLTWYNEPINDKIKI